MFGSLVRWMRPPSPLAGRLATQSLLFALGEGTFMTGSAVFFTQIVGLSAAQVGLGLTLAGVAAFIAAYPMGKVVDRFGAKRCWAISAAGQASLFTLWPFIDSFTGYVAMAMVMEVVGSLGGAAYGAYTIDVLPPDERVMSRAYMYSALNVGFTLGALMGGIALAFKSNTVLESIPWFTAIVFMINAAAILRLPHAAHDQRTTEERKVKLPGPGPLRNIGWMSSTFFVGVLWTNQVLLHIVIPLWLVEKTDAPRVLLAFLFGTNTVMCIFLPMAAARGVKDVTTALRAIRVSTAFFVASCLITLYTHDTVGWATIALVWLGHVTVTGAELYLSAASWAFEAELMDPRRRGDHALAAGFARRPQPGGPQAEGRRARTAAQPGLAPHHVLLRGLLDQSGAAQHRDSAVARGGDRRPAGAAGLPVRDQHGDVHLPADGGGPRSRGRADRAEGGPDLVHLLRGLLPDHVGHP